jgi:hypothetical protein
VNLLFDKQAQEKDIRQRAFRIPPTVREYWVAYCLEERELDRALGLKALGYWEPLLASAYGRGIRLQDLFGLIQREIRTIAVQVRRVIPEDSPVRWEFGIPRQAPPDGSLAWQLAECDDE